MRLVAVEANIGVGKSTLLPRLVDALNFFNSGVGGKPWRQIQEPADDPKFMQLLDAFYKEPTTENRVKFQYYVTNRRHDMLQELDTSFNYVIERSLYSDLIFCQLNFLEMECPEGRYMNYYYNIKRKMETYPKIDDVVYLTCDPSRAVKSIKERGRECEQGISYDYISELESFHRACLPQQCRVYGAKLHTFDWTDYGCQYAIAWELMK